MLARNFKLLAFIACALLSTSAFAQQADNKTQQPRESQFVDFSGFKGKVFDIKHRDPRELVSVLMPLGSGFKGATIQASSEFKTLTVRDFPENIAAIEEALKRMDVPLPAKPARPASPNIEVTAYVLIASNDAALGNTVPALLKDVVTQLQTTLSYKNYQLLVPIVQRTRLEAGNINSNGTAALPDKTLTADYKFAIGQIMPDNRADESGGIYLGQLHFSLRGASVEDQRLIGSAELTTKLNVRDGEKVVVGTASLKDKALILVLTAKVLK